MATQTTNYNLIKPAYSDPVDVAVLNDNADIIDETLAAKANLVSGKVPASELPSYVDDIIEGYYYNSNFYEDAGHTTLITGETGKIYLDLSTEDCYRWSGSVYVHISAAPVQSNWNENDSTSMAYVQNRTHYEDLRTELADTSWDGDFSSANAPSDLQTITLQYDEGKRDATIRYWKLSDNYTDTIDMTSIVGKVYANPGMTLEYSGTYADVFADFTTFALSMGIPQAYIDTIAETIQVRESQLVTNVLYRNYGAMVDDAYQIGDYAVLIVSAEGDYAIPSAIYSDGTYTDTIHLEQGVYAISIADESTHIGYGNPIYSSSVVTLDRKYLPASLETDISNLQTATSNLFYDLSLTNASATATTYTATSDKSATEIIEAINSGKTVRIISDSLGVLTGNVCSVTIGSSTTVTLAVLLPNLSFISMQITDTSVSGTVSTIATS